MADKVLVVDHEREIRDLLKNFLLAEKHEVIVASDGEEALELAKRENPQLILLNIEMPRVDGIETCKRLKAEEKTRLIPIIMVNAFEGRDLEAFLAGAADIVNYPFDMVDLASRVSAMLRVKDVTDEMEKELAYIRELGKDLPKA